MSSRRALIITGALGVVQSLYYYTQLPKRVAIHFGSGGMPDSWDSSEVNLAISIFLYLFLVAMFIAIPATLKYIPLRFISLPNREYWLADERKETSIDWLGGMFNLYGTALIVFFLLLGHLVYLANMSSQVVLNEKAVWVITGGLLMFTLVWMIRMFRRFRMPGEENR